MSSPSSRRVILAALFGNTAIAAIKTLAAMWTGSSAMASEAIHSFVDTGNQLLLLWGLRQSARPATAQHPFGHGLRLYVWTFLVAVMIFGVGACVSIYEGITKILHPEPLSHPALNFVVLGLGMLFEGFVFCQAWCELKRRHPEGGIWAAAKRSKDPTVFTVLFEDAAALAGLAIAALGIGLSVWLHAPWLDGAASILIGLVLATTSGALALESESLLAGEAAHPEVRASIALLARSETGVRRVNELLTMHFGPRDVLVAVSLDFDIEGDRTSTPPPVEVKSERPAHSAGVSRFHPGLRETSEVDGRWPVGYTLTP